MPKIYGIGFLKAKLAMKSANVRKRYLYYDMKNHVRELSRVIPAEMANFSTAVGWCGKAVDSLADRIAFDSFQNDDFLLDEIFRLNNADVLFDSAILSALISSCSFLYIGMDENQYPKLQVIDGGNATGIIDSATCMLTEGYAVLERDENGKAILEAYFRPNQTDYFQNGLLVESFTHSAPFALLVPIINRPDAKRPFGHSRISRACMEITNNVMRTLTRLDVSAEFYSFPQKYIVGLAEDADFNNRAAIISSFLDFRKDEDGDKPTVGQFQQQSTAPYLEQLKSLASLFAGETGLTLDDFGFSSTNPSSSEAIRAGHENLRLTARKAQRCFGVGFLNVGYLASCLRDGETYERSAFRKTALQWYPVFEPDASALAGIGDAIGKINQVVPDFMGSRNIKSLTGLESDAVE